MVLRDRMREGMVVRNEAGKKLGTVRRLDPDRFFIIDEGALLGGERLASYERVLDVRGDEIIYAPLEDTAVHSIDADRAHGVTHDEEEERRTSRPFFDPGEGRWAGGADVTGESVDEIESEREDDDDLR